MNEIAPISVSQAVLSDTLNRIALLQSSGLQDESRILCQWVIDQDPENACAHHFLAIAHLHAHELGDAVDSLDRALALEPDNPHFLHLYAVCLNVVGEYDKAVEVACAALAGDRARYDSWTLLADSLLKLGKLSESEKAVRQAIEIDPQREEAFMGLSRLAAEYGSHARAEAILDHAIALCATPPMHLRVRRLSAALAADNIAYIEEHLETALKDAREEADVLELLRVKAWTLFYVDRADEAIALLEGAVSERPDPGLMSLLSLFLSETERVHDAIAIYERMLEAHPDEHGTRFNLSL
ncbi:MAG TPA: tetratricopeptide repeat protein, partial [Acetobacteraceae bacterium]|nr:tetratricopeptide repeat protein [Acetobacteraceae bacterium]